MNLRSAVEKVIRASGLPPYVWAERKARIPKSTFRTLMEENTASGRTLARLQKAGVEIADRRLIASLDRAA